MNWTSARIAIVGAGAVGAYYGGRLAQHGYDVHFLLRGDYEAVAAKGWTIRSCHGDFTLPPQRLHAYSDARKMPLADLVIVALKATSNDQYEPLIRPLLKADTAILTLQNGLGNEERLAELFGAGRILGGLAFVCINRIAPGVIHHMDYGQVNMGEFVEGPSARAAGIVEMFTRCGIQCQPLDSLRYGRWEKLIWNVPFSGLGGALGLNTQQILASEAGAKLVRDIMGEVIAGAAALGIRLPRDIAEQRIAYTRTMGPYRSSMQIDRELGRPMEVEAILGEPTRQAMQAGVHVPCMIGLYRMLQIVNLGNLR